MQAGSPADRRAWIAAHMEPLQALLDVTAPLVQQTQALQRDQFLALFNQAHRLEWLCLDLASTADQFSATDWLPVIQVMLLGLAPAHGLSGRHLCTSLHDVRIQQGACARMHTCCRVIHRRIVHAA